MNIIIGCPVYKREWILPYWLEAIERQDFPLENIGFVFEAAPDDEESIVILEDFGRKHNPKVFDIFIHENIAHAAHPDGKRVWSRDRYRTMVELRNRLLTHVSAHNPDRFFSLDSDILLENPRTISELAQLTSLLPAVSPLMFMTPKGMQYPSMMTWKDKPGDGAYRERVYDYGKLIRSDVIMAAVMMTSYVLRNTRYRFHKQGEDLGWSFDCHLKGYETYCASYLYCPHIMNQEALQEYLKDGDPRGKEISQRKAFN